ncbi:MAG: S41 family peptidase, partial [Candidatus Colwellbacteria bacterium]|nr:S41 family peptidase [Candidatus Colwellbacteria bacterium]
RAKDKILKIDDTVTNDLTVDEAVKLIRGDIGTRVVLNIFRDEWEKSKDIEIIRAKVDVPTVDWSIKDGGVLYLQLYNFNGNTGLVFYKTMMDALSKGGIRGIVLDLRNNPGGYLDIAVDLAGWFLEKGDIVAKERFADGQERIFKANGNKALKGIPLVALINGGSASASEILAGALKVNRGIKLIGEKSFGKGTVQELQELKDGSTLKITIANWLLPDNSMIEKIGLTPDVEIKLTDEDFEAKKDPQLDKALEILRAEIAK